MKLVNRDSGEIQENEVYIGDIPTMTDKATLSLTVQSVLSFLKSFVLRAYTLKEKFLLRENVFITQL